MDIARYLKLALCVGATVTLTSCGTNNLNRSFDSILDLYERYDVVHLGERHWNMTDYNFRISFVNYPRFAEIVDDIVIESGNYLYQDILDKYILELKDVPKSELQNVWRNHVSPTGAWDAVIYKEFINEVRAVNENLAPGDRIRVIASDPPIDWSKVHTVNEWLPFLCQRNTHAPEVIKSEVIDKGRKALVIYGGAHFYRSDEFFDVPGRLLTNLEELIEEPIFTIQPLSGDDILAKRFQETVTSSNVPLFLNLKSSEYSELNASLFFGAVAGSLGGFTDGILYLGAEPDLEAEYDPEAGSDSTYQVEFRRRQAISSQWR